MSLEQHGIITDVKPSGGGWRYKQALPDGRFQRLPTEGESQSAKALVEQVRQFRINMGLPQGDPELDVARYIAQVSPHNNRFHGKGVEGTPAPTPFIPLVERMRTWVDEMLPKKPKRVHLNEANHRAQACIGCPQNIDFDKGCGACAVEVRYRTYILRGRTDYELDEVLRGCRIYGCHTAALIFLDRDELPDRDPKAPERCWVPIKDAQTSPLH